MGFFYALSEPLTGYGARCDRGLPVGSDRYCRGDRPDERVLDALYRWLFGFYLPGRRH